MFYLFAPSFFRTALIFLLTAVSLTACGGVRARDAAQLAPFSSDGCSLFPDGSFTDRNQWCDCCQTHDRAYWQGGSAGDREQADALLRDCVLAKTNDPELAETMYLGARLGGHPAFPTWYRWGYGWPYGRGYQRLSAADRLQVHDRLATYAQSSPAGYCVDSQ